LSDGYGTVIRTTVSVAPKVCLRTPRLQPGIVSKPGSTWPLHDQAAREPWKIRACGSIPGSLSSDPVGISTLSDPAIDRGTRPPHSLQNAFVNRWASGTLN
jgi:hypothetical protein